jgi:hypothetical protein
VYPPLLRFAFVAASLALGAVGLCGGFSWAWLWLTAAVLLVVGYFRGGTVWLAWRAWRNGDVALAQRRLAQTHHPNRLSPYQRAYYEWLQGEIHRMRNDLPAARRHFTAAAEGGLRTGKDRALAYTRLAETELTAGEVGAARAAIARARMLSSMPFVEALLRDLEEAMARQAPSAGERSSFTEDR